MRKKDTRLSMGYIQNGQAELLSTHLLSVKEQSNDSQPFYAALFDLLHYAIINPGGDNRNHIIDTLTENVLNALLRAKAIGIEITPTLAPCVDGIEVEPLAQESRDKICNNIIIAAYQLISNTNTDAIEKQHTPLTLAVTYGNLEVTRILMSNTDQDINTTFLNDGASVLYLACELGHLTIAQYFLQHFQANTKNLLNKRKDSGWTCLGIAASNGHTHIVEFLVEHAPQLVNTPNDGFTALHAAADAGYTEIVEILLEKGADLEALTTKDTAGNLHRMHATALFLAADKGHLETVKALMRWHSTKKIPTDIRTNHNISPWQIAIARGYHETCKILNPPDLKKLEWSLIRISDKYPTTGYDKTIHPLHPVYEINETKFIIAILNLYKDKRFYKNGKLKSAGKKLLGLIQPYAPTIKFDRIESASVFGEDSPPERAIHLKTKIQPRAPLTKIQPRAPLVYPICRAPHFTDARDWLAGEHAYNDDEYPKYQQDFERTFDTYVHNKPPRLNYVHLLEIHRKLTLNSNKEHEGFHNYGLIIGNNMDNLGEREIQEFTENNPERTMGLVQPSDAQHTRYSITVFAGGLMNKYSNPCDESSVKLNIEKKVNKAISSYHTSVEKNCYEFDYTENPVPTQYNAFLEHIVELCCTIDRLHPFPDANIRTILVGVLYPECCKRNIPIPIMFDPNRFDGTSKSKLIQDLRDGIMLEKWLRDEEERRGQHLTHKETYELLTDYITWRNDPGPWTETFFFASNDELEMTERFEALKTVGAPSLGI